MTPRIGITPSPSTEKFSHGTFHRFAIADTYVQAVAAAGGLPLVLPPQEGNIEALLDTLDGLLLSGGGDIRPDRYGDQTVHPTTYGIHDLRDEFEFALLRGALTRDMPVLCICRGIQVLNVALGGSLIQDIADQHGVAVEHRQEEANIPKSDPGHTVAVEPGSLLERVYGQETIAVNSFHHQALKRVSPELRVNATAPDGIIEAVERPGSTFVLGVQWHPEMMFHAHHEHARPFQALVQAATERAAREHQDAPVLADD